MIPLHSVSRLRRSLAVRACALALLVACGACAKRGAHAEWLARGGPPVTCAGTTPPELVLERALPIAITDDFQPSGLALLDGRLLTVSDRHDDAVYEIVPGSDVATLRPFVRMQPPDNGSRPTDLEGVVVDGSDGHGGAALLLASEGRSRVLRVEPSGATHWLTPSLDEIGRPLGMLRINNAGLEGLARLPNGRILVAAERDVRGLIELPPAGLRNEHDRGDVQAWAMPGSICTPPPGRGNDFADLAVWNGQVFALERNCHVVMRIERTATAWVERGGWSYARTENAPRFAYHDRAFGVAEGLAIDDRHVFIVMDNNHDHLAADANDRRPRLFVFAHPK